MCSLLAQENVGRCVAICASDEELEKKKKPLQIQNPSWTLCCQDRYRRHTTNASSGHQYIHKPAREALFYKIFVSRRRFLLRGSSPHVPNRPSVFRTQFSSGLKQPITALNPCRKSLTMPQPPQKDKIMPSRASALRFRVFFKAWYAFFLRYLECLIFSLSLT